MRPIEFYPDIQCDDADYGLYFQQGDTCEGTPVRVARNCAQGQILIYSSYQGCNTYYNIYLNNQDNWLPLMPNVPPTPPGGALLRHIIINIEGVNCDCP
jgi:hypothetical protein